MTPARPPAPFEPLYETIAAGTVLFRVHGLGMPDGSPNDGTIANPGFGKPTRFAFFGEPTVPVLYAADRPEAAVHETILHDVAAGGFIPRAHWSAKVLTAIEVRMDLVVVSFHGAGLRRLGQFGSTLTDTDPTHYPVTVQWAEAAWRTDAVGASYRGRQFNSAMSVVLFADKVPAGALVPLRRHRESRVFAHPAHRDWLAGVCADMGVSLRP